MIQTYNQIIKNLSEDKFSKIYLLMGEETFFIKKICQFFENNFIEDQNKSFNQEIFYGRDISIENIISSCKSFPMMSDKKLVIIKEAQELDIFKRNNDKKNELLINYLSNVNPSTTLIFCLNNKTLDKRGKLFKSFNESSCILDSSSKDNKIYDNQLPKWIESEVMKKKYSISNDALLILTENIGNDLEKIDNALNKIYSNIESKNISKDDILNLVGINREYNLFEFQDSLIDRNSLKCGKIMNYFTSNEKKFPIQQLIIYMYGFYSKLLVVKSKNLSNPDTISSEISVHPYVARSYARAIQNYTLNELFMIISFIKELDLVSKGLKQLKADNKALMGQIIYKLFYR
ncbi:MAG: DNA polymerase III subunit delta [Flammeovirgaceae bacterium]|nr:DNA polymerase III subunit delta [Flammeovirgaceae bacterium]